MIRRPPRSPLFPTRRSSDLFSSRGARSSTRVTRPDASTGAFRSIDRKSTRLNSSHLGISYAAFCLKKVSEEPASVVGHGQWDRQNCCLELPSIALVIRSDSFVRFLVEFVYQLARLVEFSFQ